MADIFNDPILSYKNFKMGSEIDVSGTFIFNGMKELEQMDTFNYEGEVFSFLYHIAVGIERLQKVLVVMLEEINAINMLEFEESLITHSHQELQDRIKRKCFITFHSRENGFLQVLSEFYKKCRYDRFNISGQYGAEKRILIDYIRNNLDFVDNEIDVFSGGITNTTKIKEFLGRVIGSISRKYYSEISNRSRAQNIYTYELRHESKAAKIFLPEFRKNSLQEQNMNEKIAFKEFIVFLVNTQEENSFFRFLKEIEPLELDVALANQYLEDLCKGTVSQELMDTVEFLYEEHSYSKDRIQMIDLIGNSRVMFEFSAINKCYDMLNSLISGDYDCYKFAVEFPNEITYLEDDEANEILIVIPEVCKDFIKQHEMGIDTTNKFMNTIREIYDEFKNFYSLGDT